MRKRLLVTLAVLVVLAMGADYGSAAYAEYRVSRELRAELELGSDPEVLVNGFPFLTQAASGRYASVDVRAAGVPVTGFGNVTVEATLRGVDVPTSEILAGSTPRVVADSVDARVRIGATDLGRYLDVPDLQVSVPPRADEPAAGAPQTGIELTGTIGVGAAEQVITVQADLSLQDGLVVITATNLVVGEPGAPTSAADTLLQRMLNQLSARIDPAELPFALVPTDVRAEGSDIVVEGRGTDVVVVAGRP